MRYAIATVRENREILRPCASGAGQWQCEGVVIGGVLARDRADQQTEPRPELILLTYQDNSSMPSPSSDIAGGLLSEGGNAPFAPKNCKTAGSQAELWRRVVPP